MTNHGDDMELRRRLWAIGAWENEGGAPAHDAFDYQYGRRVENDGSWTLYHVFTGVPANVGGHTMTGLTQLEATDSMLSLNPRNGLRFAPPVSIVVPEP
jgi:hypothetical protein